MPNVAFEPSLVLKPILNARPADRAPEASFDSLLDSLPHADDRRASSASDDSRADRPEPSPARDKSSAANANDTPRADAKANDKTDTKAADKSDAPSDETGDAAKASDSDKPVADAKTETTTETKTEAKTETTKPEKTAEPADAKLADVVPADVLPVTIIAAPTAAAPVPTLTPADAIAPVATPATDAAAQVAVAEVAATAGGALPASGKGKSEKLTDAQTQTGKAADPKDAAKDAAKDTVETTTQPHNGDKLQAITGVGDKEANAQTRGEAQATGHRAAAAAAVETASTPAADKIIDAPKAGADAAQLATMTARPQLATPAPTVMPAAAQLPQAAAVPLAGVAIEITNKALSGTNHFEIRLDPPELGRIEVRLEVDRDGNVTTRMIADRSDTLDLLRRDQSGLERALQDAGLKTSNNGTQFSLRDHTNSQQQSGAGFETARLVVEDEAPAVVAPRDYGRLAGQSGGLDIHV